MNIKVQIPNDIEQMWSDEECQELFDKFAEAVKSLVFVDHEAHWQVRFHEGNVLTEFIPVGEDTDEWHPAGVFVTSLHYSQWPR